MTQAQGKTKKAPRVKRIHLARKFRADGYDSSDYVIAILTNEVTEAAACARADAIAATHEAEGIACHDGSTFYRLVTR